MNISTSIDNWGIFRSSQTGERERERERATGHAVIEGLGSVLPRGITIS